MRVVGATMAAALTPAFAFGQPVNHIGEALAEIFVINGCVMTESAAVAALQGQGLGTGDYQAQVTALHRGGYLVSGEKEGQLQLVNWGVCS